MWGFLIIWHLCRESNSLFCKVFRGFFQGLVATIGKQNKTKHQNIWEALWIWPKPNFTGNVCGVRAKFWQIMSRTQLRCRLYMEPRPGRPELSGTDLGPHACLWKSTFHIRILKMQPLDNFLFLWNVKFLNTNCSCIYLHIWPSTPNPSIVTVVLSWMYIFPWIRICMIALRSLRQFLNAFSFIHSTSDCLQIS